MRRFVVRALLAGAWVLAIPAPAGEPAWVSLWAVEVPPAAVVAWQEKPAAEWFNAARAEVAAGRAEEAAMLVLSGTLGGRMRIESLREVIYPTEYEPGGLGCSFVGGIDPGGLAGTISVIPPFLYPISSWTGLAFETRNTGEMVEAEVTPGCGAGNLGLRLAAEWVRQDGEDVYLEYGQDDGGTWKLAYPCFVSRRINVNLDCTPAKWTLAGMVDPWREEAKPGRKALVFVRVETDPSGK